MGKLKTFHTLTGGQDSDTSSDYFKQDKLRDVVNMELIQEENAIRLQTIRSTKGILQWIDPTTATDLNVLAVVNVQAIYEAGVVSANREERESVLIFSYDSNNGSQINLIDVEGDNLIQLYPNGDDNSSLDFPPEGSISASFTRENSIPQVYWDDYRNELRKIDLVIGTNITNRANITKRSMSVRRRLAVVATTNHQLAQGGSLPSGSYQIFARLYNTITGDRSKWSLASNPIPICDPMGLSGDPIIGSFVGQIHDRKIIFNLDVLSSEIDYYDSYQLAIVKSIDGLAIPSTVAYVTLPEKDNYQNVVLGTASVEYKGNTGIEKEVPLEQIVGEDAGIEYAKVQCIKDNRLWRGNIKYFDYKNDRGEAKVENAETISVITDYKDPLQTTNRKGHWRDEVYAYGLGYLDEFGNVGLVEPLDLSKFYKYERTGVATIVTAIVAQNATYQQYTVTMNTSGINVWDYLEIGGVFVTVCEVNPTSLLVKGNLSSITTPTVAYKLIGKAGNHTDNWAWKYPSRDTPTFSLLDQFSNPLALGLRLTDITDYPSWAKAVIVVRQKRQKNILFQTPHIPTIGVSGVPTFNADTYLLQFPIVNAEYFNRKIYNDPDYVGIYDTLMPKILGMGMAKNIARIWLFKTLAGLWQTPVYRTQALAYGDFTGNEIPNYIVAPYPAWVYNYNGTPVFQYNLTGGEKISVVDAGITTRIVLDDQSPFIDIANYHDASDYWNYFFNPQGYHTRLVTQKIYLPTLTSIDGTIDGNKVTGQALMVLNQQPFAITQEAFESDIFRQVNFFGYGEKLSNEQGESTSVPKSTRSFLNAVAIQRAVLLSTRNKLRDFTYQIFQNDFTNNYNIFPFYPLPILQNIYLTGDLENVVGSGIFQSSSGQTGTVQDLVNTVFVDKDTCSGGMWILNVEKGLDDDRYSKTSTDWIFTGAYAKLETNTNGALSFDVWGGDCFITLDSIKVNNNTNRISDPFSEYRKTGSFVNNVEFMKVWLESEVNTYFAEKEDEFPAQTGTGLGKYTQAYLKQYNGSFSINNELKTYVSDEILQQDQRPQLYPARFVWSDVRIYQATDSAFFDTDGFSIFSPLSRQDLDEQYGGINGLVDFADPTLHFIQERKVRVEPVGRDFIERGDDGTQLILTDGTVVGKGGYYLPYQSGTQHMRTVQSYNGVCFYADQINKRVAMFGARGSEFKFVSDIGQITFFNSFLEQDIKEKDLFGFMDTSNLKQHYHLIKNVKEIILDVEYEKSLGNIFNLRTATWESKSESRKFLAGITIENILYALTKEIWRYYKGNGYGELFNENVVSKFSIIASPADAAYTTVFDSIVLNKEGTLTANVDSCNVSWYDKVLNLQKGADVLAVSSYLYPTPIAPKNNRWWINRIRDNGEKARGTSYVVEFVIRNGERFGVYNVECNFTVSFRN